MDLDKMSIEHNQLKKDVAELQGRPVGGGGVTHPEWSKTDLQPTADWLERLQEAVAALAARVATLEAAQSADSPEPGIGA